VKDRLGEIFERQLSYYKSLSPVMLLNGFFPYDYPLDIQDRKDQEHLRLLAWRLTEELIEALNSYNSLLEELSDALHFLVELSLASGVSQAELSTGVEHTSLELVGDQDVLGIMFENPSEEFGSSNGFAFRVYRTIDILGQTMNSLRQRPWRREDRPSDRKVFVAGLSLVFKSFINAVAYRHTDQELFDAYFAKAKVNDERQKV